MCRNVYRKHQSNVWNVADVSYCMSHNLGGGGGGILPTRSTTGTDSLFNSAVKTNVIKRRLISGRSKIDPLAETR